MMKIDVKQVLARTVSPLYPDLVTRPTGQAVRNGIEHELADTPTLAEVAVIDFGTVRVLDISCADEIVGKLLREHGARYFVLWGLTEAHRNSIEQVLERHQLAVVGRDRNGRVQVLGPVKDAVRRAFGLLADRGSAGAREIADHLGVPRDLALATIEEMVSLRIAQHSVDDLVAIPAS
ncbi:MAG TPA: hypothetical protein VGA22_04525 [Gemmatimonadales bacterium]|jgi:hypothetical protein